MKHYKIFEHPAGNIEAVKLGWSWPAFLFGSIWALCTRMWWVGGGVLVAQVFIIGPFIESAAMEGEGGLIVLFDGLCWAVFGINGNRWRENKLQARGYDYKDIVSAGNPEGAIAPYLKQKLNTPVQPNSEQL